MPPARRYSMALRDEQTAATRRRILDAAGGLFVDHGYPRTTLAGVAEVAGVSVQTIYNLVGGKSALLKAVWDVTVAGDDEPVPMAERPMMRAVLEATDRRECLVRYAAHSRALAERALSLYLTMMAQAAGGDPDLSHFADTVESERLDGAELMVCHLAERFGLRTGLDLESAADVLWAVNAPDLADRLVNRRGWGWDRYERWLAGTLADALLGMP